MNSAWHRLMVLLIERKAKAVPSLTVSTVLALRASGLILLSLITSSLALFCAATRAQ
ncbi:hypothetical protein D3C78_1507150 [compost metagenome]